MHHQARMFALLLALSLAAPACAGVAKRVDGPRDRRAGAASLHDVRSWAYQIQGLEEDGAVEALVNSAYDMLVIEPTRSVRGSAGFDTAGLVARLHQRGKLVLAYIDIGEAEDYRLYWEEDWQAPGQGMAGEPDFLVTLDPDGWSGNYPVAFWDERWKAIVIYDDESLLNMALADGFDGVYMDWIEAFSDPSVAAAAAAQGRDPALEMVRFVGEIRTYSREKWPAFLVVAQNGADLVELASQYTEAIDGLAQENLFYAGAADTEWGDPRSGDISTSTADREYLLDLLEVYREAGVHLFCVDYTLRPEHAADAYRQHQEAGCAGYVSQSPLSRLTDTPPPR